jgi:Methyltransferase domain
MGVEYFLRHPGRVLAKIATDPLEVWSTAWDRLADRRERRLPQWQYCADPHWESSVHQQLLQEWPCPVIGEFNRLLPEALDSLTTKGLRVGPESFGGWNDGDVGLTRAIYCLVRHLRPKNVVETGVAHGMTSRFILEALRRNGDGHLWSIDLPPLDPKLRGEIGAAVTEDLLPRWTLLEGSSRRLLPRLLKELGEIELFIHDSLHSERNVRFELGKAWPVLAAGGVAVVDDIDANYAFRSYTTPKPGSVAFVCDAEPIRLDLRRFNKRGMFGILLKRDITKSRD